MYIIAIGWLYVAILAAATESSLVGGVVTFLFWGLLPCALLMWLGGSRARRQRRRQSLADQRAGDDDRRHPEADQ
jgi:biotin transporter BioY